MSLAFFWSKEDVLREKFALYRHIRSMMIISFLADKTAHPASLHLFE